MSSDTSTRSVNQINASWVQLSAWLLLSLLAAASSLAVAGSSDEVEAEPLNLKVGPVPEHAASCPEGKEHAAHAAQVALHTAQARMRRYAYAPRDGRRALGRAAEAVECARLAGEPELVRRAAEQLARIRARINGDVRDRLGRYQLLKRGDRLNEAFPDIYYLVELGWPEAGELADQLRRDRETVESDGYKALP